MENLLAIIGPYYGLDWVTMLIGTTSSYLFSERKLRIGFTISIAACLCSMSVAFMAYQTGFIVYNALLIAINMKGIIHGDRRGTARRAPVNENLLTQPEAVPVRVHAQ